MFPPGCCSRSRQQWVHGCSSASEAIDIDDRIGKRLRRFLRQIVPNATLQEPVPYLPENLFA
jgi:hypothetical protein